MRSNIVLLLRSRLARDCLSSLLLGTEFSVFHELIQGDKETVVVIDFEDCDREVIRGHQRGGAKIVVLADEADCQGLDYDQVAPLSGVLTYNLSAVVFVRSLRLICSGQRILPPELALQSTTQAPSRETPPQCAADRLSSRERQIISHLAEGCTDKAIARSLSITEATVKAHLKSLLGKINLDSRTQAVIWALSNLPDFSAAPRGFV
jgi:two-component system, NarL family, nitrate/nitrite response regulator NarL